MDGREPAPADARGDDWRGQTGGLCLTARGMQVMNAVLVEMMEEEG